jgi:uncharacterized protein YqfA (UPF0365 family)
MRGLRRWQGMRSAVLLIVGFLAVLFTYFAVNLWVSGLHSYAGVWVVGQFELRDRSVLSSQTFY